MKKKKLYNKKTAESKVNEPVFPYHTIRKSSLIEMEEENRLYSLNLTPEQRLSYLKELNINAYGRKSLQIIETDKHIYKKQ